MSCYKCDSSFYAIEVVASIILLQEVRCIQLVF
jgi:hypothetical protein